MAVHVCDYSVDSEIQMNEDIMGHLLVEMIHAHLGLLGHLAPKHFRTIPLKFLQTNFNKGVRKFP